MSYTYGPQRYIAGPYVYFGGDQRVVHQKETDTESVKGIPAWLVADWMIAKSQGQPLTQDQEKYVSYQANNAGLRWLRAMLT